VPGHAHLAQLHSGTIVEKHFTVWGSVPGPGYGMRWADNIRQDLPGGPPPDWG
jgi:hypothetical protein